MSKINVLGILIALVLVMLCIQGYTIYRLDVAAQQGAEAHAAACSFRDEQKLAIFNNLTFLATHNGSPAVRTRAQTAVELERLTLKSLRGLHC